MATGSFQSPPKDPSSIATAHASQVQASQIQDANRPSAGAGEPEPPTLRSLSTPEGMRRVRKLLRLGLNEFQIKLNSNLLKQLEDEFIVWANDNLDSFGKSNAKEMSNDHWLLEVGTQPVRQGSQAPRYVCDFLFYRIDLQLHELARLKTLNKQFRRNVTAATTTTNKRELILHFAQSLDPDPRSLALDEAAFGRWFDEEALSDRFLKHQGEEELLLCFALGRLAATVGHVFRRSMEFNSIHYGGAMSDLINRIKGIWQRLKVESSLLAALVYEGDVRIHVAAIRALREILEILPEQIVLQILSQRMVGFVDRAARQKNSDVWLQCEAMNILSCLSLDATVNVIDQRLTNPGTGDDLFVRQHAWGMIESFLDRGDGHGIELQWPDDPNSFVRQKMAGALFQSLDRTAHRRWRQTVMSDNDPKVRAAALVAATRPGLHVQQVINYLRIVPLVLKKDKDDFVLRTALWSITLVLQRALAKLNAQTQGDPAQSRFTILTIVTKQIQPAILQLQSNAESTPVRRWAAQCNERLWGMLDQRVSPLLLQMGKEVSQIKPGRSKTFPLEWFDWLDDVTLTRIFAILSQNDFGCEIEKTWRGLRVSRGPAFGFRLWRLWHELRRSATDKRQGHRHTIGRVSTARLKAPSQILGELSETKVPGEPVTIGEDSTWRPFLPLVDDLISVLNMSWFKPATVKIVSSQGVTTLTPPANLRQRVSACYRLTKGFSKYATLRNWNAGTTDADSYIQSVRDLGFEVTFEGHQYPDPSSFSLSDRQQVQASDSSVSRFFNSSTQPIAALQHQALLPLMTQLLGASYYETALTHLKRFAEYFTSLYENTLGELLLFTCVVLILVMLKHAWMNYTFRRSRKKIPFSIGGWGTRGKSGTERLKAALLGGLGHGLVSKTTGCEAMFIHAYPFGHPLEIPFFRPYDKATIWEQRNLVNIAAKLKPSVFLWECMALNPDYVYLLQRQWMQDDLATITNTYPDHEDIQGPAGYNVAQTIACFVPDKSVLVTTEEQMKPYVTQNCERNQTKLQSVGWLESGLITEDILARFPYQEHPDNIALVSQMASNLGMSHEEAVKAMADDLVPDLGVLKTHATATVRTRRIEFTNGMSANERFGCMGNWKRLKYDTQDPWTDPTTWVVSVINNRADRVARSRVFAKIIVEDVNADRFFLIGTNLNGLKKFIDAAWQDKAERLTLKNTDGSWDVKSALETFENSAWQFRQPIEKSQIETQLRHMVERVSQEMVDRGEPAPSYDSAELTAGCNVTSLLKDTGISSDYLIAIERQLASLNGAHAEYREMRELITDAPQSVADSMDEKYRNLLGRWFAKKLVVVSDHEASGEKVIHRIVNEIPPGYLARTMGMQNIKGTGMDFVYRFHAWDTCFAACEATQDRRLQVATKGIEALMAMPAIGQLCVEKLAQTIAQCRTSKILQGSEAQSQLDILERRIKDGDTSAARLLAQGSKAGSSVGGESGLQQAMPNLHRWSVQWAEEFLDVNDSIRRREKSELIYRDFVACRISRQRAVVELRKLNKRQKGGWLKEDSRKVKNKLLLRSK